MKSLMIALTIALAILAFNTKTLEAQCPPGYNSYSFTAQYSTNCTYLISFCYTCDLSGPSIDYNVKNIDFKPIDYQNSDCPPFSPAIEDWLIEQIRNEYWDICSLTPCDEGVKEFTYIVPLCIKRINKVYIYPDYSKDNYTYTGYCSNSTFNCITKETICRLPSGNIDVLDEECWIVGSPDCPETIPTLPPPGYSWLDEWETSCFQSPYNDCECP